MSSLTTSHHKLFSKRKQSSLDNKISSYTHYITFGITDCETIEGSLYYRNYIAVGRLCDREVIKQHF